MPSIELTYKQLRLLQDILNDSAVEDIVEGICEDQFEQTGKGQNECADNLDLFNKAYQ